MDSIEIEEQALWRAVAECEARTLVIGRQAVIMLGSPVGTVDYDFWVHIDDIAAFNQALEPLGLTPNRAPEEARRVGRYVLENDIHVDVLVARAVTAIDGRRVAFDDIWPRRQMLSAVPGAQVAVPSTPDLIATKMFGARSKDATDIAFLQLLLEKEDK